MFQNKINENVNGDQSNQSIWEAIYKINPNALLIGFGRRFATYKRAHLLLPLRSRPLVS